jgi:hypothetical protein
MKIVFEFQTIHGMYRDALHLPDDHGLDDTQIEAMKQQRVDNFIAFFSTPPVEEVAIDAATPTEEM